MADEIRSYRYFIAWRKAMALVAAVYRVSVRFRSDERFGLTIQVRRSAVSVPSNIAEGRGRESSREFAHFLSVAYGSLMELETQLILEGVLGFVPEDTLNPILIRSAEVGRLINGLKASIVRRIDS